MGAENMNPPVKNMNYGGDPSELIIFFMTYGLENQMKVLHKKCHISKSIIEEVEEMA